MEVNSATAQETRDQFLQLLVTQLQNQDPLEPVKQEQFLSQLAQFSTLEGVENLNATIHEQVALQETSLRFQQLTQAATLVGTPVDYLGDENGTSVVQRGVVSGIVQEDGQIRLRVGDELVAWESLIQIGGAEAVAADTSIADEVTDPSLDNRTEV